MFVHPKTLALCASSALILSGCAAGSSASFTQAPLFYSERYADDGSPVAASTSGSAATATLAGGSFSDGTPGYLTAGGSVALPLAKASLGSSVSANAAATTATFGVADVATVKPELDLSGSPGGVAVETGALVQTPVTGALPLGASAQLGLSGGGAAAVTPELGVTVPAVGSAVSNVAQTLAPGSPVATSTNLLGGTATGSVVTQQTSSLLTAATSTVRTCLLHKC